jgi:hypothetical protein
MKLLLILSVFILQSCATYIGYTYDQQCANKGMVLSGANETSGVNTYSNGTYGRSYYDNVSCRVPANNDEKREIALEQERLYPINEYNSGVRTKQLINGIGYYLLILPGVGLKFWYDHEADQALKKYQEIRSSQNRSVSSTLSP